MAALKRSLAFPKVIAVGEIDAQMRASAEDYVNRVNWLFETWDLEGMIESFTLSLLRRALASRM